MAEIQILFFIIIKEGNMAKQTSTLPQYQYKKKHGFFYEKNETYIETEKMYEVLYEMEVVING